MHPRIPLGLAICFMSILSPILDAAELPPGTNMDEAKVPPYTLPDPLVGADGARIGDAQAWRERRRPELLELYRSQMHGRSPGRPAGMHFTTGRVDPHALNGLATRKEITVSFEAGVPGPKAPVFHLLLYLPNAAPKPAPAFVGMNFGGNESVSTDPGVTISDHWEWDSKQQRERLVPAAEGKRGGDAAQWCLEKILAHGYALATLSRDIEPDYPEGWRHGIRGWFLEKSGKGEFAADDWGAVAAWAWSLSRALDYLETDSDIDAKRVAVMGHSRLGKAALWAGAPDERFAIVISNDSGEGGAALARRRYGETTAVVNQRFPHWFCGNFKHFSDHADQLPFDQHELLALIAPRPLYVASAEEDRWADPRGEFLSAVNAEPVYRLFGLNRGNASLGNEFPPVNHPVGTSLAYHIRPGKHDVTEYDWEQYLAFADRVWVSPK